MYRTYMQMWLGLQQAILCISYRTARANYQQDRYRYRIIVIAYRIEISIIIRCDIDTDIMNNASKLSMRHPSLLDTRYHPPYEYTKYARKYLGVPQTSGVRFHIQGCSGADKSGGGGCITRNKAYQQFNQGGWLRMGTVG